MVNLDAHSGRILHLTPVSRARVYASEPLTAQVTVRLLGDSDHLLSERGAPVMASSDERQDNDLVTIVVPSIEGIRALELVVGGSVVETRRFGTGYPAIAGVQVQLTASGSQARAGKPAISDRLRLSWTSDARSGPAGTSPITYTVQRSGDAKKTWETLAVGLTKTELIIESFFEARTMAFAYRIIASDGIHTIRSVTDPVVAPVP